MTMQEAGMITKVTAAGSQDLPPEEVEKAEKEQAEDAARIMKAQTPADDGSGDSPRSRSHPADTGEEFPASSGPGTNHRPQYGG